MANQIVVSSGAKVRNLEGVLTGTSGVVSSVPYGGANGVATLDSGGKVPVSQLPSSVVTYLGTWNAATNTPYLVNGTGDAGDLYICNVAGTANFGAGPITFAVGDWVLYGSGTWQKSSGQNGTVTSVAASITGNSLGITGSPITTAGTLAFAFAGTNLQYINGAGNLTTFPSLTGYVPYTGATGDVNLGLFDLKTAKLWLNDVPNAGFGSLELTDGVLHFEDADGHSMVTMEDGYLTIANASTIRALLNVSGLSANRDYAFPNASGTLALTSDISYPVTSVFGRTGAVVATSGDYTTTQVTEGTNLYYTDVRARASNSFVAGSGAYNSTTGVITIPTNNNQITNGASYITLASLSATSPIFYNSTTGVISSQAASATLEGYITTGTQTIAGAKTLTGALTGTTAYFATSAQIGGASYNLAKLNVQGVEGTYLIDCVNGTEGNWKLRVYNNGTSTIPGLAFKQGLFYDAIENSSVKFYRGATFNDGYLALATAGVDRINISNGGFVGIGNSNTTYNLDVTGTGRYTGVLTLGSTISNGTYTYTLPSATGTLALTSQIPSVTGYVPYTGATGNVDLGTYKIISNGGDFRSTTISPVGLVLSSNYDVIGNPKTLYTSWGQSTAVGAHEFRGVNGSGGGSITSFYINSAGASTFYYSLNGTSASFSSTATATAFIPSGSTIPSNGMYLSAANTLNFATNSLQRLTITSDGYVIIGSTATSTGLGTTRFQVAGTSTTGQILVTNSTGGYSSIYSTSSDVYMGRIDTGSTLYIGTGPLNGASFNPQLTIASTGESTFNYDVNIGRVLRIAAYPGLGSGNASIYYNQSSGVVTFNQNINCQALIGTGTRAVLVDSSGNFSAPVSDISVKKNIQTIGYGLKEINEMNPVWFHFIDEYKNYGVERQNGNIAQEMGKIIPEAVFTTPQTGKMGINYDQLHAVYIKAIQELHKELLDLKAIVNTK